MARDFLKEIVAYKKELIEKQQVFYAGLKKNLTKTRHTRYHLFKEAIAKPGRMNLIAEIKKASPSQGLIRDDFDVRDLARTYAENGADAISVLTEDKYFLGKPRYLREVSEEVQLPVLAKDFIIDEMQIYEAFSNGASAILLIVAILDDKQMKDLIQTAAGLDMDCLVEVHGEPDLDRALEAQAEIIGINHRDLHTLAVDMTTSERLIPRIPKDTVIVAESGIKSHDEIVKLKERGVHAVLIGETFLRERDVGKKIQEIMKGDVPRKP